MRANPISETITTIDGYPNKLVIFKVPASKYWWCRCYFNKRYYKQSTSTENKVHAKSYAINFYEQTILSTRNLVPKTPNITFENIARDYLQNIESHITTNEIQEKRKKDFIQSRQKNIYTTNIYDFEREFAPKKSYSTDFDAKRNKIDATMSRYYRDAEKLIKSAESGKFPNLR